MLWFKSQANISYESGVTPGKVTKMGKSIYAKTTFENLKKFRFWTMGVMTFHTHIPMSLVKKCLILAAIVYSLDIRENNRDKATRILTCAARFKEK